MAILPGQNYYYDSGSGKSYPSGSGAYSGGDGVLRGGDHTYADGDTIKDAGGHDRISFTDAGSTLLKNATGVTGYTLDSSNNTTLAGDLTVTGKLVVNGTGNKIGNATSDTIGFYGVTPVDQPATVADATDNASAILRLNEVIARLKELGLIA